MENVQFGGEEHFAATPEKLFDALTDLEGIEHMIPDVVSAERRGDGSLACVVRPGFSFLRGTLKLVLRVSGLHRPSSAAMEVAAQGIGVSMHVVSQFHILSEPGGSLLRWQAELRDVRGLIATVSPGLVRAAADQVIHQAWKKLHERL